jgi:hypothetical protein
MMSVTADRVRLVYDPGLSFRDEELTKFIENATLLVTESLSGKGLTAARLDLITIYVAAHLLVLSREGGGLRRSRLGEADESYVTPNNEMYGFNSTRFGQTAVTLDTTGTLAGIAANKGLKSEFRVV